MSEQPETDNAPESHGPDELLSGLIRLVAERIPDETQIPSAHSARRAAIDKQSQQARKQLDDNYHERRSAMETEFNEAVRRIQQQFESQRSATQNKYESVRNEMVQRFSDADEAAERARQESRWEAMTVFEATKDGPANEVQALEDELDARWQQMQEVQEQAAQRLRKRRQWRTYTDPEPANLALPEDPIQAFDALVQHSQYQLQLLLNQGTPRLFEGAKPFFWCILIWLIAAGTSLALLGIDGWYWIASSVGATALVAGGLGTWLFQVARGQSQQAYLDLRSTMLLTEKLRPGIVDAATRAAKERYQVIVVQRDRELKRAERIYKAEAEKVTARREAELKRVDLAHRKAMDELTAHRDHELSEINAKYPVLLNTIDENYRREAEHLDAASQRASTDAEMLHECRWQEMKHHWQSGLEQFQTAVDQMNQQCSQFFPDWSTTDWDAWTPVSDVLPRIRLGQYRVELDRIPGGIPENEELRPPRTEFGLPLLLPFPEKSLLLLKAAGGGRDPAVAMLQAVMLRMLTSLPPGKVRFTILDPVGLGENFAAFMHLADYDEQLVASRIWTDASHIPRRLSDLTEHMENVLQVYLRNEFESIQQYNAFAGEMAEPYRILVVANFPANFSEEAVRRLTSIVSSGARCGVFTLMSLDTSLAPPQNFSLPDLEHCALSLAWKSGGFVGKHAEYGELPLAAEWPPEPEKFTEIVRAIGRKVPEAGRIEVPFSHVAPEDGQFWTGDSRGGIDVPLGRAGAMKLQDLRLGKGTSQHVLISGKTGSGKSTLLHILITNAALRYSPDEIEFYLIDFKKGVEFKAYATRHLPHARVIAIESEREFGLSVLERLDSELHRRGDLFRSVGVQDLHGFRDEQPQTTMPRILLIIDEFQELFVEEDRISQSAALLMDRLVRQGRAFGIHVLLGSQTLGGAYSLARSTLGQMAVRIALQCSEADAHLILSEENSGARLLSRPGEAIYNDANGLVEGNHPFQVAWLDDHYRDDMLDLIHENAKARGVVTPPPTVFEGNIAADIGENVLLGQMLASPLPAEPPRVVRAWLGSAVAIKDATAAVFARQSGADLLIVGQQEEAALGMLASAAISLAAQDVPGDASSDAIARLFILDGTRPDAPEAGFWDRLVGALPLSSKVLNPGHMSEAITAISDELDRREQGGLDTEPPVYLIIHNLSRFRDLRRGEDDFGFSSFDENKPANPSKQFTRILRDGPALGIHTIVWCDTLNNVNRWLDRQALRDIEMRVALQMNATDSSSLIDSPAAAKLGVHRAILYHEGQGWQEKLRPYAPPSPQWLDHLRQQLTNRPVQSPDSEIRDDA